MEYDSYWRTVISILERNIIAEEIKTLQDKYEFDYIASSLMFFTMPVYSALELLYTIYDTEYNTGYNTEYIRMAMILENLSMIGSKLGLSLGLFYSMLDQVANDNSSGAQSKEINTKNLPNMTQQDILNNLPEGWTYTTNNGFTHVRDANGVIRMRIDPPDAVTNYKHIHLYDANKNPLDINGNIVSPKSPDAHIPIKP